MKPIRKNKEGAASGALAILAVIAVLLLVVLAVTNGMIDINLPGTSIGTDEYTERVNRRTTDVGLLVPVSVLITGSQTAGDDYADLDITCKPKHEPLSTNSDNNYVPTPDVISQLEFNTKVGNKGGDSIYAVNGNSFTKANTATLNTTLVSAGGVSVGYSQNNYQAWTSPTTPAQSGTPTKGNTAIFVLAEWEQRRKGTNQVLDSADVYLLWYVDIPDYNQDSWSWSKTYTAYFYVPFNDYAVVEDIIWKVTGYAIHADIEWTTVTTVTYTWWEFPILNKIFPNAGLKLASTEDTVSSVSIEYSWRNPSDYSINNGKDPWSHSYTYKVR